MRAVCCVVLFLVMSCGGDDQEETGPCQPPNGAYWVVYTQRPGGSCPNKIEHVETVNPTVSTSNADVGASTFNPDKCEVILNKYVDTNQYGRFTYNGKFTMSRDGTKATGLMTLIAETVSGMCVGTFDVTMTKQ